ncbi:MAG: glycoside hydrolase [Planctomycetes bacterium]|nr:glycoside hydrolase [Planctomycetota bacterium]
MTHPLIVTIAHASDAHPRHSEATFVERGDGSILVCWQEYLPGPAGGEDDGNNRLASMVSHDGGLTWGEHRVLVETAPGDVNVYSPSFLRHPDGSILFTYFRYHQLGHGKPTLTSGYFCRSTDDGKTFSAPTTIWSRLSQGFASHVLKRLANGRLILPLDLSTGAAWGAGDHSMLASLYSDDEGKTWRESDNRIDVPMRGAMEGHVAQRRDGSVLMVLRTQLGSVFHSISTDGGATWSKPQTTGLHAPESCPELQTVPRTGDLCLAWNNAPYDPAFGSHFGKRSPLTLTLSRDDGRTWLNPKDIESNPKKGYYNPVLFFTSRGSAILSYTELDYNDRWCMTIVNNHLKAAVFSVEWLYT